MLKSIRQRQSKKSGSAFKLNESYSKQFATIDENFAEKGSSTEMFNDLRNIIGYINNEDISPAKLRYEAFKLVHKRRTSAPNFSMQAVEAGNSGEYGRQFVVDEAGLIYAILREKMDSYVFVTYKFWEENVKSRNPGCEENSDAETYRSRFQNLKDAFPKTSWKEWVDEHVLIKLPVTNLSMYCQFPQLRFDELGNPRDQLVPFCPKSKVQIYIRSSRHTGKSYQKRLFGSKRFLIDLNKPGYFEDFESNSTYKKYILRFTNYIFKGATDGTMDFTLTENLRIYNDMYENYIKDDKQSMFNKLTSFVEQIIALHKSTLPSDKDKAAEGLQQLRKLYECQLYKEKEESKGGVEEEEEEKKAEDKVPFESCMQTLQLDTKLGKRIAKKYRSAFKDLDCKEYEKFYTTGTKLGLTQGASVLRKVHVKKRNKDGLGTVERTSFFACKPASKGGAYTVLSVDAQNNSNMELNRYVASVMDRKANDFMKMNNLFRAENGRIMHRVVSAYTLLPQDEKQKLYRFIKGQVLLRNPINEAVINKYLSDSNMVVTLQSDIPNYDFDNATRPNVNTFYERLQNGDVIATFKILKFPRLIRANNMLKQAAEKNELARVQAATRVRRVARR